MNKFYHFSLEIQSAFPFNPNICNYLEIVRIKMFKECCSSDWIEDEVAPSTLNYGSASGIRSFIKPYFLHTGASSWVKNPKPQKIICIDVLQSPQTFFRVTKSGHCSIFPSDKWKWFPLERGLDCSLGFDKFLF